MYRQRTAENASVVVCSSQTKTTERVSDDTSQNLRESVTVSVPNNFLAVDSLNSACLCDYVGAKFLMADSSMIPNVIQ